MKKINYLVMAALFAITLLSSCSTWVKVVEVKAANGSTDANNNVVFENDVVKVTYDLWGESGSLKYKVYNKTDKPVYVNWYKAAYIESGRKYVQQGAANTEFLPPQSYILNPTQYILLDDVSTSYFETSKSGNKVLIKNVDIKNDKSATMEEIDKTWKKMGKTKVYSKTYTPENSPLNFRNYITVSTCQSADDCTNAAAIIPIDNNFYVSKITEMKVKQFRGKGTKAKTTTVRGKGLLKKNNKTKIVIYEYPYKQGNRFYMN